MALKKFLKNTIPKGVHVSRWVGYAQLKEMGRLFYRLFYSGWVFPAEHFKESVSFEIQVKRFALNETDLIQRHKQFQRLIRLWLALFMLAFSYGIYLAVRHAWLSVLSVLVLSVMMLCQVFQYHFWSFQIMQRRVCTLQEWWHDTFQKRWPW